MSETTSSPEPPVEATTTPVQTTEPPVVENRDRDERRRPSRLNAVAAWVGIVAGTVFVIFVIFATGFMLGAHSGGHRGGGHHGGEHRDGGGQMHHMGPMFRPGPGDFGPGGPGPQGPGAQGPGAQAPGAQAPGPQGPGPGQSAPPPR